MFAMVEENQSSPPGEELIAQGLADSSRGESVSVRYGESGEEAYVDITGSGNGSLFDHVAGRVIYAMAAHSDSLMIERHEDG